MRRLNARGVIPGTADGTRGPSRGVMSIEKESSGLPEVNVHKRTTKVNFGIVIGVAIFFAAMSGVIWWLWSRNP